MRGDAAVRLEPGEEGGQVLLLVLLLLLHLLLLQVVLAGGSRLPYNKLLIATGSAPRKLGVPGEGLEGVSTLRYLYSVCICPICICYF